MSGGTQRRGGGRGEDDEVDEAVQDCFPIGTITVYNSVLVAAFGGVRTKVGSHEVKIHPAAVFLLSVPLFVVQLSSIFALRLDLDVKSSVSSSESSKHIDLLLQLKLLMVVVLQMETFRQLIQYVRMMIFIINPVTWVEIKHPTMETKRSGIDNWTSLVACAPLFHPLLIAPWGFMALAMQFLIQYLVCVDSVSIILVSDSVLDAVCNCLSIVFIVDLNQLYWEVCEALFHFMPIDGNSFFKISPGVWHDVDGKVELQKAHPMNMEMSDRSRNFINKLVQCMPMLRRSNGRVVLLESILVFVCLFFIYVRQFFVVIHAVDTDVLPIARDICTQYRMYTGHVQTWYNRPLAPIVDSFLNLFVVVDLEHQVRSVVQGQLHGQCALGQTYFRLRTGEMWHIARRHYIIVPQGIIIIFLLFIVPQSIGNALRFVTIPSAVRGRDAFRSTRSRSELAVHPAGKSRS